MEESCIKREKQYKAHITNKGVMRVFKKYLLKSKRLLDLGSGDGALLQAIKKRFANIEPTGIDIEPKSDHIIKGDISKLPFEDNCFDCITCTDVIEHLPDDTLESALDEMYRVLKAGGHVLVTTLLEEDLTERACLCPNCGHVFHRVGHQQSFSAEELFGRFTNAGFRIKKTKITHFGLYSYYPVVANVATWFGAKLNLPQPIKKMLRKDIIFIIEK
jgi:ubiquinone/menaquinone biosynthesis C-methylase UbiE